jgi:putative transposase
MRLVKAFHWFFSLILKWLWNSPLKVLRPLDVLQGPVKPLVDAVRQIGVTVQMYYRYRKEYGDISDGQLKRLKLFEIENKCLRHCLPKTNLSDGALKKNHTPQLSLISTFLSLHNRKPRVIDTFQLSIFMQATNAKFSPNS